MTVANHIADQLFKAGIRQIFGIPGGPSIPYMEAFRKAGIEFILVSNESSAGIMADVTARLTGVPGICHATYGPGATNLSTGVGSALLDRSPVIVFTSEMSDQMLSRTTQMHINHQQLFEPLTKATFRMDGRNAGEIIIKALQICREEYPGPVHIGLPSDLADSEILPSAKEVFHSKNHEPDILTDKIVSILSRSKRPVLAVGLTAARLGIKNDLLPFLEKYRMPVVITPMAKGIIPDEHPCFAGVLFHALSNYLEELWTRCDLVIGLGYDQVEYNYESWMPDVPLVHFDTIEKDLPAGENILRYTGTPGEWFSVLANLDRSSLIFENDLVKRVRNKISLMFSSRLLKFGPVSALQNLKEELPDNSIITADVGSHLHLLGQYWPSSPEGGFIITNGWSGMGFGIPAAIAVKMCRPRSPAVCITGDGGFLMMAGEIITARRNHLPIIVVILSDGELNLIKLKQSWKDIPAYGTSLYEGDLFGADTFLGVRVINADSKERMSKAVRVALSLNEPVIINAIIDPEDYKYLIVRQ
jgi:acetolactate synthase-1/2/3 large subunit